MDISEIQIYLASSASGSICVHRERIKGINLFVLSIYIVKSKTGFILKFDFEPIDLVSRGEGWIWITIPMERDDAVLIVENFTLKKINEWENFSKTGRLLDYYDKIDDCEYREQETKFLRDFSIGEVLLPNDIVWANKPI